MISDCVTTPPPPPPRNPLVSSEVMSQRMASRKMVRIPRLLAKVKGEVEGDWVSIGVIVDKLPPK